MKWINSYEFIRIWYQKTDEIRYVFQIIYPTILYYITVTVSQDAVYYLCIYESVFLFI